MEFRVLGPVEVVDNGTAVTLGPAKQRALLADLLLHANEVLSRDRLVEDLWGDRAPETAATALHGYVSQLRKALETTDGEPRRVLVTRPPGYVLEVDADQVDVKRFEVLAREGKRKLASGDARAASATLAEALSLWRGPPLQEFDSAPFVQAERLRLEELRLSTVEDRIEADLALGRHEDVAGELETLVASHPFRERLAGQLILALYRSGRQVDALDVYGRTRRTLVAELGIEPGPALQELQQAVLRHDEALAAPQRDRAVTPASPAQRGASPSLRRLFAVGAVGAVAVALVVAFSFVHRERSSLRLAANSVGFVDGDSGDVTKSFAVGREPRALVVAFDSIWVANYRDETVTRLGRDGRTMATIAVGRHPIGVTAHRGKLWVWTVEQRLVPIDPRFDAAGDSLGLGQEAARVLSAPVSRVPAGPRLREGGGALASGGGFLWITVPPTAVIRVDPAKPERAAVILPDEGVRAPVGFRDGEAWVAGYDDVYPIAAESEVSGSGVRVGLVRSLAFGGGDLWVVARRQMDTGIATAVRRIDRHARFVDESIDVGYGPVALAAAGGSIWVASTDDRALRRIDAATNRVAHTTALGARPTALAADGNGVWVAVG